MRHKFVACVLYCALGSAAFAGDSFTGLGHAPSQVAAISANGLVLVGAHGQNAAVWRNGVFTDLGTGYLAASSSDGQIVVGNSSIGATGFPIGTAPIALPSTPDFVGDPDGGLGLPPFVNYGPDIPSCVTWNGRFIAGTEGNFGFDGQLVWGQGISGIGWVHDLNFYIQNQIACMSADGSILGGSTNYLSTAESFDGPPDSFPPASTDPALDGGAPLPKSWTTNSFDAGFVTAISADGHWAAGWVATYDINGAETNSANLAWHDNVLISSDPREGAASLSADGSAAVVGIGIFYAEKGSVTDLETLLSSKGLANEYAGWTNLVPTCISADGQTIAGYGTHNGFQEGFEAHIARKPLNMTFLRYAPSVVGGDTLGMALVLTSGATGSARTVSLRTSDPSLLAVPASVSIPIGTSFLYVPVVAGPTNSIKNVQIGASFNGVTQGFQVEVDPPQIQAATSSESSVTGGNAVSCTVSLTYPTIAPVAISLSGGTDLAVPASVTIPAGKQSATFSVDTQVVESAVDTSFGILNPDGTLFGRIDITLKPAPIVVSSLSPSSLTRLSGLPFVLTVTLKAPAPKGGAPITVSSDQPKLFTGLGSVTVPEGASSKTFEIGTKTVYRNVTATVSASFGGQSKSCTVTVVPYPWNAGLFLMAR